MAEDLEITPDLEHLIPRRGANTRERTFSDPPIPLWRKLLYATGGLPKNCLGNVVNVYFMQFLLETALLPAQYAGAVLLVGRVLDAFSDPIAALLFSRTQTRFGKYRPWLLASMPFCCIFFTLLWYVPPDLSYPVKTLYYLAIYWLFFFSFTCFNVPMASIMLCGSNNQHERESLIALRMCVEQLGAIVGILIYGILTAVANATIPPSCTSPNDTFATIPPYLINDNAYKHENASLVTAFIFDGLFFISAIAAFCSLRENYTLHTDYQDFVHLLRSAKSVLFYRPFRFSACCLLCQAIGLGVALGNYALFFKYVFHETAAFTFVIGLLYIASGIFMPFWLKVVLPKIGKKWTATIGLVPLIAIMFANLFLPFNLILYLFLGFAFGLFFAACMISTWTMLPDVIAAYSLEFGYGKEPFFYAITNFIDKLGFGFSIAVTTWILGAVGYDQAYCVQPESVILALRIILSVVPAFFLMLCLLMVWLYPISESRRHIIREDTKRRMSTLSTMSNKYGSFDNETLTNPSDKPGRLGKHRMSLPSSALTFGTKGGNISEEEPPAFSNQQEPDEPKFYVGRGRNSENRD